MQPRKEEAKMGLPPYSSLGFLAVAFLLKGAEASCCPMEWLPYQGYCYKLFHEKVSWSDAELICQSFMPGSHLASIHSNTEASELANYIVKYRKDGGNVWIGLRDTRKNRVWSWTDRSSTSYKAWNVGEPNNLRNEENCVEIWSPSGYMLWNDESCKSERAFLCRYKL
ncbi:C-type lectin lectoxin-Thr1-like [Elgaria multicarinata webbii]|uniref:C-type lectin lectoxin-Thr1-like n=1 Tax=Elgaria multicarinata webbii TaxID=159646 RepID=UPI002FCCC21D